MIQGWPQDLKGDKSLLSPSLEEQSEKWLYPQIMCVDDEGKWGVEFFHDNLYERKLSAKD